MAELGVGHERAVDEQARSDAGAEGEAQHDAVSAFANAPGHLGHSRCIGVVQDRHRSAEGLGEQAVGVDVDPAVVDVGGAAHHAVADHRGHADAHRPVPAVMRDQFDRDLGERLRRGRTRRVDAVSLAGQLAGGEVDGRGRSHHARCRPRTAIRYASGEDARSGRRNDARCARSCRTARRSGGRTPPALPPGRRGRGRRRACPTRGHSRCPRRSSGSPVRPRHRSPPSRVRVASWCSSATARRGGVRGWGRSPTSPAPASGSSRAGG